MWSRDGRHIAYVAGNQLHIIRRSLTHGFLVYQVPESEGGKEGQRMELMLVDWLRR